MSSLYAGALVSLMLALPAAASAPTNMRPGQWEVAIQMNVAGHKMPENTFSHCVTQADVDKGHALAAGGGRDKECTFDHFTVDGGKATWAMACNTGGAVMHGTADFVLDGDTYTGHMSYSGVPGGGTMDATYRGRRVGECAAK